MTRSFSRLAVLAGVRARITALLLFAAFAPAIGLAAPPPEGFADLVDGVKPAVVNVAAVLRARPRGPAPNVEIPPELLGTPFEDLLRRLLEPPLDGDRGPEASLGSGFIVDPAGYIVTSSHVIENAAKVQVTLADGRKFAARVAGRDEETDIALLKIDATAPLPYALWGDSDKVRVGDWVLAVGNPFGLGGTVTAGIISARGRDIQSGRFDDFLQIDAPINRGNSGGPSFDRTGRVIGMNTAIFSPSGGSIGIAFAVPSSIAKPIVTELRQRGHIERGWLGVNVQGLNADLAASLGLTSEQGALVIDVSPGGPAATAGVRRRDVILGVDAQALHSFRDLARLISAAGPGNNVTLRVWRDGREIPVAAMLGRTPPPPSIVPADEGESGREQPPAPPSNALGLVMQPVDADVRHRYRLTGDVNGVLVARVERGSIGREAGFLPGDVILEVGDRSVREPREVLDAFQSAGTANRKALLFLISRDGAKHFLAVALPRV
jgi:serine protease Do